MRVSFSYPGAATATLRNISLQQASGQSLAPVGENGSGRTSLIKLLTRLYTPDEGRILLDGSDLLEWDEQTLRRRIVVIFPDYIRYQMTVGENLGVGDLDVLNVQARWRSASTQGGRPNLSNA